MIKQINDLVTIVVPVYKCGNFIEKCVNSIINQTYANIEIIIVLDGEMDESGIICRNIQDKRIRIISKENEGVSIARNVGIDHAHGKWIAFIDGDDWIELNYIERLVVAADEDNCDVVICDYFSEWEQEIRREQFFSFGDHIFELGEKHELIASCLVETSIAKEGSTTNVGVPWAKLYLRAMIEKNNLRFVPRLKRMQDTVFNLFALSQAANIKYIGEPLYHYTKNTKASTSAYTSDFHNTAIFFLSEVNKFIHLEKAGYLKKIIDKKTFYLIEEMIMIEFVPRLINRSERKECIKESSNIIYNPPFVDSLKNLKMGDLTIRRQVLLILLRMKAVDLALDYYRLQMKRWSKKLISGKASVPKK